MMSVEKYINNKIQNEGFVGRNLGRLGAATAGAIVGAPFLGVGAIPGAIGGLILRNIMMKRKWKESGCDKLTDKVRKKQCKEYLNKQEVVELRSSIGKCKGDPKCIQQINKRIQELINLQGK